jgi:hypothetical protein
MTDAHDKTPSLPKFFRTVISIMLVLIALCLWGILK